MKMLLLDFIYFPLFSLLLIGLFPTQSSGLNYNGNGQKPIQVFPLDTIEESYENSDEDYGLGQLFREEGEDEDYTAEEEPSAHFWLNAIGPFLFTFEDKSRQKVRQLWEPVLAQLNWIRQQSLGQTFNTLTWDDKMARALAQKDYTEMAPLIVPMAQPQSGLVANLKSGMQMLLQAVLWRYIRCERKSRECKGKRDRQSRFPIELVDSEAKKIGCVARLFKIRGERRLQFGALCTTDRSMSQPREELVLFRIGQLKNGALRKELWRKAGKQFKEDNKGDEADEGDDEEEEEEAIPAQSRALVVRAEEGDLLQAKVDAIVNPAKSTLTASSAGPQTGQEAIPLVLVANSPLDLLNPNGEMEFEGKLNQKRLLRALKRLAQLVDPSERDNQKDLARARQAQKKVQKWQEMASTPSYWDQLLKEAANGRPKKPVDGISERIIRAGGKVLAQKLAQLAQEKGGTLAIGDAVMTESFQIGDNFFAKKIIHTVPPTSLHSQRDKDKLAECYKRTLKLAVGQGLQRIAFPEMLPAGSDESARQEAVQIGLEAIKKWVDKQAKQSPIKSIVFLVQKEPAMLNFYREQIKRVFGSDQQKERN